MFNDEVNVLQNVTRAVAYCRVSSQTQVKRGDGLSSQETRCREFATREKLTVDRVFFDEGVSGGLIDRPGMREMLAYLEKNTSAEPIAVIIDDISRLARGLEAHLTLRTEINAVGGRLVSPSIAFGEDSDSRLIENLLASVSQHQRQKNTEQVVNRMRARVLNGYYVFAPPVGYRYERVSGHGKILVRDEPMATAITEGLLGYASGRFRSVAELKRFLQRYPGFSTSCNGSLSPQTTKEILGRPLYAGYISVPQWDIEMHPGKHEALIDFSTFQRIQQRLQETRVGPHRADVAEDFPLRGFVACSDCEKPMTANWSKGRSTKYPYYICHTKGCVSFRKSVRREKVDAAFEAFLHSLQPAPQLFHLIKAMLSDLWEHRLNQSADAAEIARKRAQGVEKKISGLMERLLNADSETLINAYENQIKKLENEKVALLEQSVKIAQPRKSFEETFRTACALLSNPWKIWASDELDHKRALLRILFRAPFIYDKIEGVRTAAIPAPFRVLADFCNQKSSMVEGAGFEPA